MSTTRAQDRTDLPGEAGAAYAAEDEYRPPASYAALTGASARRSPASRPTS